MDGWICFEQNNDRAVLSSKDADSVGCYRASNPSNLQQEEAQQQAVLGAVPCESRESKTKAKLVMIVTSCSESRIRTSSPHCFLGAVAYATTVEGVVVEEEIEREREKGVEMENNTIQ